MTAEIKCEFAPVHGLIATFVLHKTFTTSLPQYVVFFFLYSAVNTELFFCPPSSPTTVPKCPKELCTPKLRQLLSPIFDSSCPSSPDLVSRTLYLKALELSLYIVEYDCHFCCGPQSSADEVPMDTGEVEKFFANKPEETQKEPVQVDGSLTSQK